MPRRPPTSAEPYVPESRSLNVLRTAARTCKGCDLWKVGTQTVFGAGDASARAIFVGEQPGDKEDLAGEPFVGPAGALLSKALQEAGINRQSAYVTNAVKHFKWEPRGKKRIHKKPGTLEIAACRPWLDAEIEAVHPEIVVCLGATAAQALLGKSFKVTQRRGELITTEGLPDIVATVHPSSILRAPDETRHEEYARFVADLKQVASRLRRKTPRAA
jgi:uracil-DNA glycosylase family protein